MNEHEPNIGQTKLACPEQHSNLHTRKQKDFMDDLAVFNGVDSHFGAVAFHTDGPSPYNGVKIGAT